MNFLNSIAARGAILSRRRWLAAAGLGTLVTACGGGSSDDGADALMERLQSQARKLVSQGVVGAATGWADSTRAQVAVAGLRRLGGTAALERGDLMAIGSNTKAMTACAAASVVDQGLLRWDSTLAQTLPGLAREALPAYQDVTLRQLLDHRAGVMAFNKPEDVAMFLGEVGTDVLTRLQEPAEVEDFFLQWLLRQAPVRGTGADPDFAYSNAGYALAARMLRAPPRGRTGQTCCASAWPSRWASPCSSASLCEGVATSPQAMHWKVGNYSPKAWPGRPGAHGWKS